MPLSGPVGGLFSAFCLLLEERLAGEAGDDVGKAPLGGAVAEQLVKCGKVDLRGPSDVPCQGPAEERPNLRRGALIGDLDGNRAAGLRTVSF
jgi:hypothetical protein